MKAELTYGYFGPVKIYSLLGCPLMMRVRTRARTELHILIGRNHSIPIGWFPLSRKYRNADRANAESLRLSKNIFHRIERARAEGKKIVLYVLDYLIEAGGVERRLALQFEWLEKHNVLPVLVCEKQNYQPLSHIPTIFFAPHAPHVENFLIQLVGYTGASVVEFQMKSSRLLHSIDLTPLKSKVRTGCMIHGAVPAKQEILDSLDYRATSNVTNYLHVVRVPNVVSFPPTCPLFNPKVTKALYIGRIDSEKLPTLKNFVAICLQYGFKFEIAGPLSLAQKAVAEFISTLPQNTCIGTIDTRAFLMTRGHEYAFIGGVGQVPLEAAAANLPALITPHFADVHRSVFLTNDNLSHLLHWNCVIKGIPERLVPGNTDSFFDALLVARQTGDADAVKFYRVRTELEAQLSADEVWTRYLDLLFPTKAG